VRVACAAFLSLKTAGEVRQRAVHAARRVAPVTVAVVVAFAVWTVVLVGKGVLAWLPAVAAVIAVAPPGCSAGTRRAWSAGTGTAWRSWPRR
jgi:cytochrome bd ubiquinol oxidase subunit II